MNNRWRRTTKYMDSEYLYTISSSTGRDENFNSWVDYVRVAIDKGNNFEYKVLATRDCSAWHTPSFRKGVKNYAVKHR